MKLKNNISIISILVFLTSCVAAGYFDSEDPKTLLAQGYEMEGMSRFGPAEARYLKALRIVEEKNDKRMIAYAKNRLGYYYRNPHKYDSFSKAISDGYIDKSIKYFKESLEFYVNDNNGYPHVFESDMYTALVEVYDKKGDNKSSCFYLRKLKDTYNNKLLPHPLYSKKGYYDGFYNPTKEKFKTLRKLIEYYNQKIGCGI